MISPRRTVARTARNLFESFMIRMSEFINPASTKDLTSTERKFSIKSGRPRIFVGLERGGKSKTGNKRTEKGESKGRTKGILNGIVKQIVIASAEGSVEVR